MSYIKVRVNGRGNAWPVVLGQEHPFYDRRNYQDLANASFSIVKSVENEPSEKNVDWDLMIDTGHGTVQYLLKNCNRIPEAVFLTHPHIDHTLGLDWIVQSYYKTCKKPYPVYATVLCWEFVKTTFPQLESMIDFKELVPFETKKIEEVDHAEVTPFPIYHGKSAVGAAMLLFNVKDEDVQRRILFTGDILVPLLRDKDYKFVSEVDLLITDANNRFPYPKSNHWSIIDGNNNQTSELLAGFKNECNMGLLLEPHLNDYATDNYSRCFDYFLNKDVSTFNFYFTIKDFVQKIKPKKVALVHYSGGEDLKYYQEEVLTTEGLKAWAGKALKSLSNTKIVVPYVSEHIDFLNR